MKDISMEEFIAAQIANRIKIDFRTEKELTEKYDYKFSEGSFIASGEKRFFLVKFKIADKASPDETFNPRLEKIKEMLEIANKVVFGYKFKDFEFMELFDQLENARLRVSEKDIYNFNKNTSVQEIVEAPAGYF